MGGQPGDLPVKCHIERRVGDKCGKAARAQVIAHKRLGVHPPADAKAGRLNKAGAGGDAVAGQRDAISGDGGSPVVLQAVLVVEAQRGGAGKSIARHALREPASGEGGRGGGDVAQRAEGMRVAALKRAGMRGDGGLHLAAFQKHCGMVLVVDDQIEQQAGDGGDGRQHPGGKAVGIDGDAGCGSGGWRTEVGQGGCLEQGRILGMPGKARARGGRGAGLAPDDQRGADAVLERADALRDGGRCDVQHGSGTVEAAGAQDGGKRGELVGVKHKADLSAHRECNGTNPLARVRSSPPVGRAGWGCEMTGERDLRVLIGSMEPVLHAAPYGFAVRPHPGEPPAGVFATVAEDEGLTLIARTDVLVAAGAAPGPSFARITLTVHSALEAVGLTAALAQALADWGISGNVVAGFHHDHIFVQWDRRDDAMTALRQLAGAVP